MQDRFKFRVWDKENKCLHYPTRYSNFTIVNGTVVKIESYPIANSAYLGKRISWEFDDAVIMQCIGLKDKNDKLIYEGDIVKVPDDWNDYRLIAGENLEVFFNKGGFRLKPKWSNGFYVHWLEDTKYFEIIGNIYENPELLEAEDDR